MVKKLTFVWLLAATLLLSSCEKLDLGGLFHPGSTDVLSRVSESLEYNNHRGEPEINVPSDNYSFYACSDVHAEGMPRRLAEVLRRQQADTIAPFLLILGDLIATAEAWPHYAALLPLDSVAHPTDTVFTIAGNHDLFYNNWYAYRDLFHTSTYCFHVNTPHYHDLFIMLDSGSGTLGDNQLTWMRDILRNNLGLCRHIIVCMHHNLFKTDHSLSVSGNLPLEETFSIMNVLSSYDVDMLLQGHSHLRDVTHFDGVDYITLDDLKDNSANASYLVVEMGDAVGHRFVSMKDF